MSPYKILLYTNFYKLALFSCKLPYFFVRIRSEEFKAGKYMKEYQTDPFKGTFGSLENLADKISDVLSCPVTIEDQNHRLLAYSTHEDGTDPARIATIIGRRVPEKVVNSLWKDGVIPRLQESDDPVRVSSIQKVGLGDRVAVSIRKNSEVLGYIWVLEVEKKLNADDMHLLKRAAVSAKSQLLQMQIGTKKKEENRQELFWKMLTGNLPQEERILEKLHELNILPVLPAAVFILQLQEEITPALEKDILYIAAVNQKINVLLSAADSNQMLLLASPVGKEQPLELAKSFVESFFTHMKERFSISEAKGAYGSLVTSFSQVEKSYKEATSVLAVQDKLGGETLSLNGYHELGIYQFLDTIYEKQQRQGYQNEMLRSLQEYDRLHKTELYHTLETYLTLDENLNKASDVLHIHMNTLLYRLKRISEITNIDLKSPHQKIMIYLDFKLNRLF
jgi:DNA-binding PucR family transcriptional regulator